MNTFQAARALNADAGRSIEQRATYSRTARTALENVAILWVKKNFIAKTWIGMDGLNYLQTVELTEEERRKLYNKMKKSELIDMLIARDRYWMPRQMEIVVVDPAPVNESASTLTNVATEEYPEANSISVWDCQAPWGAGYYSSSSREDFEI